MCFVDIMWLWMLFYSVIVDAVVYMYFIDRVTVFTIKTLFTIIHCH